MTRTSKKVEKAYQEAQDFYKGLVREDGKDLFSYIDNIYSFCRSENEKLVALLSMVLELNLISEHDLLYTYGSTVTDAVKVLTIQNGESQDDYLERIKTNPISRAVKISEYKYLLSNNVFSQDDFDKHLSVLIS